MFKLTTAAAAVFLSVGIAQAAVIDFEDFSHGDAVNSVSVGSVTATVSVVNPRRSVDQALAFDTSLTGTPDPDLEAPFSGPIANPGKVLIIAQNRGEPNDERFGGTITFLFNQLVDFTSFAAFDAFDNNGPLVVSADTGQTQSFDTGSGDRASDLFTGLNFVGIRELTFSLPGSGALDDLTFEISDFGGETPAPIPVPAALPLMLAGLGGLAWVGRRRRG